MFQLCERLIPALGNTSFWFWGASLRNTASNSWEHLIPAPGSTPFQLWAPPHSSSGEHQVPALGSSAFQQVWGSFCLQTWGHEATGGGGSPRESTCHSGSGPVSAIAPWPQPQVQESRRHPPSVRRVHGGPDCRFPPVRPRGGRPRADARGKGVPACPPLGLGMRPLPKGASAEVTVVPACTHSLICSPHGLWWEPLPPSVPHGATWLPRTCQGRGHEQRGVHVDGSHGPDVW